MIDSAWEGGGEGIGTEFWRRDDSKQGSNQAFVQNSIKNHCLHSDKISVGVDADKAAMNVKVIMDIIIS